MKERIRDGGGKSHEKGPKQHGRRDVLKNIGLMATGALIGLGVTPVVMREWRRRREERESRLQIPPAESLRQETPLTRVSEKARKFLDAHKDKLTFNNETGAMMVELDKSALMREPVGKDMVKEIRVVDNNESSISFFFLDASGEGFDVMTIHLREDGQLEVQERRFR